MWKILLLAIGVINVLSAAFMLVAPDVWYEMTPGVSNTGPNNLHFVRDIGFAYLISGGALIWLFLKSNYTAAVLAASWLGLHALLHVFEWFSRGLPLDFLAALNLLAIQTPAWLSLIAIIALYRKRAA